MIKLSDWAKKNGVTYLTAYRWFRNGTLPVESIQLETGTILVKEDEVTEKKYVAYARVSGHKQKDDLERQAERLQSCGLPISYVVKEIGSGMNPKRVKLNKLLSDRSVTHIVVEHRDRLCRFGYELLESALKAQNRNLIVLDNDEIDDDLVRDITEFMTSVCARMYGKRSVKRKDFLNKAAEQGIEGVEEIC